jgi:lipoprotein-anchoring transpeptidase ErfK/SrfK
MRTEFKLALLVTCLLMLAPLNTVLANEMPPVQDANPLISADGDVLCLPGNQGFIPDDCLMLGAAEILESLTSMKMGYPLAPLPAVHPDESLNNVDFLYAKLNLEFGQSAGVYSSLDAAVEGSNPNRQIQAGRLIYLSYVQSADVDGKHYLQLKSGEWVRASPSTYRNFQGLEFSKTPDHNFGWVINESRSHSGPGYEYPELTITYYREDIIQIYDVQTVNNVEWYLINFNQWLDRPNVRQVDINTQIPEGVSTERWIDINLYEQTMAVYENQELVFAALIATGADPYFTQPGLFQIYQKKPTENMSGAFEADKSDYYYLEDVPWTMYFDKARALHGAYWRTMFGYPQSHGCVNLSIGDSRWLYDWAVEGDWVYVHDPSGATPTDPTAYSEGGA